MASPYSQLVSVNSSKPEWLFPSLWGGVGEGLPVMFTFSLKCQLIDSFEGVIGIDFYPIVDELNI